MKTPIACAALICSSVLSYAQTNLPKTFTDKIEKGGLVFTPPKGWSETPVIANDVMEYDYAMRSDRVEGSELTCELRYIIQKPSIDQEWFGRNARTTMTTLFGITGDMVELDIMTREKDPTRNCDLYTYFFSDPMLGYGLVSSFGQDYRDAHVLVTQNNDVANATIILLYPKGSEYCQDQFGDEFWNSLLFK